MINEVNRLDEIGNNLYHSTRDCFVSVYTETTQHMTGLVHTRSFRDTIYSNHIPQNCNSYRFLVCLSYYRPVAVRPNLTRVTSAPHTWSAEDFRVPFTGSNIFISALALHNQFHSPSHKTQLMSYNFSSSTTEPQNFLKTGIKWKSLALVQANRYAEG